MTKKKSSDLFDIVNGNPAAQPGHLSSRAPLLTTRVRDEPGRIEDIMRKRAGIGSYSKTKKKPAPHTPVTLDWKAPKPR